MTAQVRDEMFAHALACLPHEACGMFSTTAVSKLVDYFHPMANAAASATVFVLDGNEMLDLEKSIDETGRQLVGVMHSHTETSAYPSPTDVRDSARFDPSGIFVHVIVSLRQAEPVLRCFTIVGEIITEVPVVMSDGDEDLHDDSGAVAVAAVMRLPGNN